MSAERVFAVLGVLVGVVGGIAFVAMFVFGYLACFTHGQASDEYFNAAFVSFFLALFAGGGSAIALVLAVEA